MMKQDPEASEASAMSRRDFLKEQGLPSLHVLDGHAVMALYFASGGADYYAETGDASARDALERQWQSMVGARMYITGGVGGHQMGEQIGAAFELPNQQSYAETCAAIANIMWNWRMLALNGEARFADVLERTLYNGFLSGMAIEGGAYFYQNPHAASGETEERNPWRRWRDAAPPQRTAWFGCPCCPTNVVRLLASLPGYFYSTSEEGVWAHLYGASSLSWSLPDGAPFTLTQETDYPWEGEVRFSISLPAPKEFTLFLRIPGWCEQASVKVNGKAAPDAKPGAYLPIRRAWKDGDRIALDLAMPPMRVTCDPRVAENRGSIALQRGPLVYCLEGADHPGVDVRLVRVTSETFRTAHRRDLLGGVTTITGEGLVPEDPDDLGPLYRPATQPRSPKLRPIALHAIPYYAWANRGAGPMTVWMQTGAGPSSEAE